MPDGSIKWLGNNFSEVYRWLVNDEPADFSIKVLDSGNPRSKIEIKIEKLSLQIEVGDIIARSNGIYLVLKDF